MQFALRLQNQEREQSGLELRSAMPPALLRNGSGPLKPQGAEKPMKSGSSVSPNVGTKKALNWVSGHCQLRPVGAFPGQEDLKGQSGQEAFIPVQHPFKETSNICSHFSNDGELTSFGTSLLALKTGC